MYRQIFPFERFYDKIFKHNLSDIINQEENQWQKEKTFRVLFQY